MNILITGYLDRNFGDDIMIRVVANQLKEHRLFLKENKKELLLPFYNIDNIYDLDNYPNTKIDRILRVTGSGFMIKNKTSIYYAIQRLICAINNNKAAPMSIIGCNIGPFINKFAELLSIVEMKKYSLITVREKYSFEFLKKNVSNIKAYNFPDIVFGLPEEWIPKINNEGCLGISAYRRSNIDNLSFYKKMALVADEYIKENNKRVLIFAFDIENENDLVAAYTIKDLCENKDMVEIICHNDNGDNIIRNMARCEKMITVRFHLAVMAIRMGISFLPVIYSDKTDNMLNDLNYLGDRLYINDFKAEELINKLKTIKPFEVDKNIFEQAKMHTRVFEREML